MSKYKEKNRQQGDEWYIVPLCHEHNMAKDIEFQVYGPLVPVDLDKYSVIKQVIIIINL